VSQRTETRPAAPGQARRIKRGYRLACAVLVAAVFLVCALGGMALFDSRTVDRTVAKVTSLTSQPGAAPSRLADGAPAGPRRAAIVDQLDKTYPNPVFVQAATDLLARAGYAVTYVPGDQVTVDFYRNLPAQEYALVILRIHSGLTVWMNTTTGKVVSGTADAVLFTGEPFTRTKYRREWQDDQLGPAYYYEGAPPLFGITSAFVKRSMRGKFDNSLVILMGCHGLRSASVAQALLERGAGAVVGWSQDVSVDHTDAATEYFLDRLLVGGMTVARAVAETNAQIGPDPAYQSRLRFVLKR
jgi:hypothetical protein